MIVGTVTSPAVVLAAERVPWWPIQSVDTMKYSRDIAREKLEDASFDAVIEQQVSAITEIGATHVAIATPYDSEFLPFLERWVAAARRHNLNVWFRGNFAGWEEWFGYPSISRQQHLEKTKTFIKNNADLFEDGDLFTACPECENGGPGDPRQTRDAVGHRRFLIDLYTTSADAFSEIGKRVQSNLFSMNGDVARLIMDRDTTDKLGGVVTIDHYVGTPERLIRDIESYAASSGGKVVLGEFGAPIPDIHGRMSEQQQSQWIDEALTLLAGDERVAGVNYWTNVGSSTELWTGDGRAKSAAGTLRSFYRPAYLSGIVRDDKGKPIEGAKISDGKKIGISDVNGKFNLPYHERPTSLKATSLEHIANEVAVSGNSDTMPNIYLSRSQLGWFQRLLQFLFSLFKLRT